jgi:hypothetical protein
MLLQTIIENLERNKTVFKDLLSGLSKEEYSWKPQPDKWCMLEVICHLYDEEREDFRARVKHTLEKASGSWPTIDPPGWVISRKYMEQDYKKKIREFMEERDKSIEWLKSLKNPNWDNAYIHPKVGPVTAKLLLSNWLAHDYLHIRQITKLKYDHLKQLSGEKLDYAGNWV